MSESLSRPLSGTPDVPRVGLPEPAVPVGAPVADTPAGLGGTPEAGRRGSDFLYYGLRNK
jgi:hypothetical protein